MVRRFRLGLDLATGAPTVDVELGRETAGREDLGDDLITLLGEVSEALDGTDEGLLITIDELHLLSALDLESLIRALHFLNQNPSPILLVAAALPNVYARLDDAPSYVERMFVFQRIDRLSPEAARVALEVPARDGDPSIRYTTAARESLIAAAGLYPYFLQMFGKHAWDVAQPPSIRIHDAERAVIAGRIELDEGFFSVRLNRVGRARQMVLSLLADQGDGPYGQPTLDAIGVTPEEIETLTNRGLMYAVSEEEVAFTSPMFADYLRRRTALPR